jgi:classical protein kinase C
LGKGAFGDVSLVKKKGTDTLYALKELKKEFIIQHDKVESVFRERDILLETKNHPNIVKFYSTF